MSLSAELTLPKGAIIKCPNPYCSDTIGRLSEDLKPGNNRVGLEVGTGQGTRLDKLPRCKRCNFKWVVSEHDLMRIHTGRGWFPPEKQIVRAYDKAAGLY